LVPGLHSPKVDMEGIMLPPGASRSLPPVDLLCRARAEYAEMPGLSLTVPQAARLLAIEPALCTILLDHLVDEGYLRCQNAQYSRSDTGRRCA